MKNTVSPYVGKHHLCCRCQHSVAVNQQQVFPILVTWEIKVHSPNSIGVDHSTFQGQPCYSLPVELTYLLPINHVFT